MQPSLTLEFGVNLEDTMAQFDKCSCTQVQRVLEMFTEDSKLSAWEVRAMQLSAPMPPPPEVVMGHGGDESPDAGRQKPLVPTPFPVFALTMEEVKQLNALLDELQVVVMWCERYTTFVATVAYQHSVDESEERKGLVKELQGLVGSYVLLEKLYLRLTVQDAIEVAELFSLEEHVYISSMVYDW